MLGLSEGGVLANMVINIRVKWRAAVNVAINSTALKHTVYLRSNLEGINQQVHVPSVRGTPCYPVLY